MALEELKAKREMNYGGRRLKAGDVFTAPPSHARVLCLVGSAEAYVAPVMAAMQPRGRNRRNAPPASAGGYERRDMVAAPAGSAPATTETGTGSTNPSHEPTA